MTKINLNDVGSLINATTAEGNINDNFQVVETAFDNTLSRDGTAPNQMSALLDMNSNPIINLPIPDSLYSPVRLTDLQGLATGGTIVVNPLPGGGTTNQVLAKNSNTNFDTSWKDFHGIPAGGNIGQTLVKSSSSDYDTTWSAGVNPGGAVNAVQYNSGLGFGGISLLPGQTLGSTGGIPVGIYPSVVDVVSAYGIDNTGITNVSTALQTAITTVANAGAAIYIQAGTYNLGNGVLILPDYCQVICHKNATIRRTADVTAGYGAYTSSMIQVGNKCSWTGGILDNSTITAQSSSNVTIGSGLKTFTVPAGLPWVPGITFLRIYSRANPANHMEATINTYSGTTMTVNNPFTAGSGTFADWNINYGAVYQAAMALHNIDRSVIDSVQVTGNWYVGLMLDGWNPSTGGSLNTKRNVIKNCLVRGVQNRGIYLYGNCDDNILDGNIVDGIFGITDYCYNFNPGNGVGSVNSQNRNKIVQCHAQQGNSQGFGAGDQLYYNIFEGCTASGISDVTTGVGFLIQFANTGSPQYNSFRNCTSNACTFGFEAAGGSYNQMSGCVSVGHTNSGFLITSSGGAATFISLTGCSAISSVSRGFWLTGSANRCDLNDIQAVSNSGNGVQIDTGCQVTRVTGRSVSNGANISDSGTGTVNQLTVT